MKIWFLTKILIIIGIIAIAFFSSNVVNAASCQGSSCYGYDPNTMGCGSDAATHRYKTITYGRMDLRYSDICFAEWERTYNSSGSNKYGEGSIRWGDIDYSSGWFTVSSPGSFSSGSSVYTAMYAISYSYYPTYPASLSCGSLSTGGPIFPPAQPINLQSPYGQNNCRAW